MQFSSGQRDLAIQAMGEAEEHTTRYYCIPPYRWHQMNYDLVTRQDREWEPVPDGTLARVLRLRQVRPLRNAASDFYRIQLNDPNILMVARRENLEPDLYPFLVYILTHEMVHLVRLSTILPDEQATCLAPEAEESRVEGVAYRILSNARDHRLSPILSKFCSTRLSISPGFQSPSGG